MRSGLFFLFFSVTTMLWSQKISQKRIARQLKKIEVFQQAHVGIHLSSLKEKKPIANYQGEKYMTPASNTKLLTFLGASQQFKTLPALAYFIENDSIIHFKSTGYPLLFHPFYKDSILILFLTKKKRGIITLTKNHQRLWEVDGHGMTIRIITQQKPVLFQSMGMQFKPIFKMNCFKQHPLFLKLKRL
jgi:hypothetical protein